MGFCSLSSLSYFWHFMNYLCILSAIQQILGSIHIDQKRKRQWKGSKKNQERPKTNRQKEIFHFRFLWMGLQRLNSRLVNCALGMKFKRNRFDAYGLEPVYCRKFRFLKVLRNYIQDQWLSIYYLDRSFP